MVGITSAKAIILFVTVAVASHFAYDFYVRRKKKKEVRKELHDVIIFTHDAVELKKSKYSRCVITPSMELFINYLDSPRYTLDICIYVLTNLDVANAVLKLHYRGVKVRIIVDADMAYTSGSNVRKLEKQGIPVRWMKSTNLMHHKFCLIDASTEHRSVLPFVMTGSLNWTNQALYGNWENVIVTSQEILVRKYKEEFDRLWVLFTPIVV